MKEEEEKKKKKPVFEKNGHHKTCSSKWLCRWRYSNFSARIQITTLPEKNQTLIELGSHLRLTGSAKRSNIKSFILLPCRGIRLSVRVTSQLVE